jgi:hypothetical protein
MARRTSESSASSLFQTATFDFILAATQNWSKSLISPLSLFLNLSVFLLRMLQMNFVTFSNFYQFHAHNQPRAAGRISMIFFGEKSGVRIIINERELSRSLSAAEIGREIFLFCPKSGEIEGSSAFTWCSSNFNHASCTLLVQIPTEFHETSCLLGRFFLCCFSR